MPYTAYSSTPPINQRLRKMISSSQEEMHWIRFLDGEVDPRRVVDAEIRKIIFLRDLK